MPRRPRMYIPGLPYHIVQRGNNLKACFDAEDLHLIRKAAHYRQPVSDERFREELSARYGLEIGQMFRGRPRKHEALYKK